MKKLLLLLLLPLLSGCENDSFNNSNPYLPNYGFSVIVDMTWPQYSQLQFDSNAVTDNEDGAGIRGLIIFNAGNGAYVAYDRACPNQSLSSCSTMNINGIYAVCPCDNANYSLFSGQAQGQQYPMKQYRVSRNGSILTIYN